MRRREFIIGIGGAAAAMGWPAHGQQADRPVIGYLSGRSPVAEARLSAAFGRGLVETGYIPGQNVTIEFLYSDGRYDRIQDLAMELVRRGVDLLLATDGPSAVAAKAATTAIPIVFASGIDPVELGLVASLNRPGGNATGVSTFTTELGPKRLGLLCELVPAPGTIAFLVNPIGTRTRDQIESVRATAQKLDRQILVFEMRTESDIESGFSNMVDRKVSAILYSAAVFFQVHRELLIALAARHSLPAMYEWPEFVADGGLMSYSTDRLDVYRQTGIYAGRILKGDKPAELPIFQASKFELTINLKTAKTLGLTIPPAFLARADEVIE